MHNGYAYYKVRNGENGRVFWKCVKLDCKARISTVNDYIASCRHEHNHLTEEEENKVERKSSYVGAYIHNERKSGKFSLFTLIASTTRQRFNKSI